MPSYTYNISCLLSPLLPLSACSLPACLQIPIGMTYSLDSTTAGEQLWFLFFCFLWTANFIAGIGSLVIAVAVATWYP